VYDDCYANQKFSERRKVFQKSVLLLDNDEGLGDASYLYYLNRCGVAYAAYASKLYGAACME
jgi:hypothetical protein